jgi:2-enoate reductase
MELVEQAGVKIMPEVRLTEITDEGVVVTEKAGAKKQIAAETVVLALGVTPLSNTVNELKSAAPQYYVIGDCANPHNIMAAVHDGFNTAVEM